jgi:hypothetical protein
MPETIAVLRPDVDDPEVAPIEPAPRGELPDGARLLLIDNGKAKAKDLLGFLAAELRERLPIGSVEVVSKPGAGVPLEDDHARELAARADLVVTGLGDCGACSACSLHDAILFEREGVPATVLITEVFVANVARFSAQLGMPGYHSLVVPHPAATKSEAQLRAFAAAAADAACAQLARAPAPV